MVKNFVDSKDLKFKIKMDKVLKDNLDSDLLKILQEEFPLEVKPFKKIASKLGISEAEVIERIKNLKQKGLIRRIGPVFESRKLGFSSALFAVNVCPDKIEKCARFISSFPEVTHNYLRDDTFNIWFTLTCSSEERMEEIVSLIKDKVSPGEIIKLKSIKLYKIKGVFDVK